jgi:GntR family transcriptional regulator
VSYAAGRPLEYVVSRYRGDRYQLHMSLGREDLGSRSTTSEGKKQ